MLNDVMNDTLNSYFYLVFVSSFFWALSVVILIRGNAEVHPFKKWKKALVVLFNLFITYFFALLVCVRVNKRTV